MINILIGGDVCPMGSMEPYFRDGDATAIFHDLLDEISSADLSVVNLECPLVSKKTPINKAGGAVLAADVSCFRGLVAAKWHVLNLANNHSFDQGADGLRETMQAGRAAGFGLVGAGSNLHEARAPFITQVSGQRVVIYAMAEREYSIAEEDRPGANPLDLINFIGAVQSFKQGGVFVVLLHGGTDAAYPTPEMVRRCRFMVDMGADAVICSHPHRPLPWELYRDRPIVYGTGNFVFEELSNPLLNPPPGWHEGYLVRLTIGDGKVKFTPIPYFQCRPVLGAAKMDQRAEESFLEDIRGRGDQLGDSAFLKLEWSRYCARERRQYLSCLFGDGRLKRKISRLLGQSLHSDDKLRQSLLLSQCETHVEVLNTLFREVRFRNNRESCTQD